MQRQPGFPSDAIRAIQGNGFTTAQMMLRKDVIHNAITAAELDLAIREAARPNGTGARVPASRSMLLRLGALLIRLGTRLESGGAPMPRPAN